MNFQSEADSDFPNKDRMVIQVAEYRIEWGPGATENGGNIITD